MLDLNGVVSSIAGAKMLLSPECPEWKFSYIKVFVASRNFSNISELHVE